MADISIQFRIDRIDLFRKIPDEENKRSSLAAIQELSSLIQDYDRLTRRFKSRVRYNEKRRLAKHS